MTHNPTACILIIGNEILSGRTQDSNLAFLATKLAAVGIPVREARVIPDVPEVIISTVNDVRARFDYVFTTGGIGPTHDDITMACMAKAFGVPLELHPRAMEILTAHYKEIGTEFTEVRQRMAQAPAGSTLLENKVGKYPGFRKENVFILPGIPRVMQAIAEPAIAVLQGGPPIIMQAVTTTLREGEIALPLEAVQNRYPAVDIGSYPSLRQGVPITQLICKGQDAEAVQAAHAEVVAMVQNLGGVPEL